jgi:hypothetical protein
LRRLPTPREVRAELQATIDRASTLRQLLRFVERVKPTRDNAEDTDGR